MTGGSGLLGNNIVRTIGGEFETFATYLNHPSDVVCCSFVPLDITRRESVLSMVQRIVPHLVIHTAGLVNVDYCERHEDETWVVNVEGTENIARAAKLVGARLINISTNAVFDGGIGMYTEDDPPNPLNVYARSKLEAERRVSFWLPEGLIVRTAFYGWSLHEKKSLAEWVVENLRCGTRIKMFTDAFFTPILVNNLAEVLLTMYRAGLSGIYHVDGSERCSKYEFGRTVAEVFALDEGLIEPCSIADAGFAARRGMDLSLDTSKVTRAVGSRLLGLREGIARFKELSHPVRKSEGAEIYEEVPDHVAAPIPYGRQWLDDDDARVVLEVLKSDWITQGPKIEEFEQRMAEYCGAKYAVAVSSGTAALHAACAVAGIQTGDEVITTPMTFVATANAIVYCGGTPVFADIRQGDWNIDVNEIRRRLSPRTKAIIPVDFAGHPADLDEIKAIAREKGLVVIEDAAHALGAEYRGKRIGSLSDMTIMSFHPVKHITTGEGGMILTDDLKYHEQLKIFRHHGIVKDGLDEGPWYYEMRVLGHNLRLTDLQCALGISQLRKLDGFVRRRREIAQCYNEAFAGLPSLITPTEKSDVRASYHIYVIQLCLSELNAGKREIFEALRAEGIGVNVHYIPVHLHPYYRKTFGHKEGDYPVAEAYYERAITLPVFPRMTDRDVQRVISGVKRVMARSSRDRVG